MSRSMALFLAVLVFIGGGILLYKTFSSTSEMSLITTFPTTFAGVSLHVELATTTADREKGLSGRSTLPNNYGMLFIFPKDSLYGFWMKDTLVPLDMFWLNAQGQVVFIAPDVATSSYPNVFYPTIPARYVLETGAGFARAHHVTLGNLLSLKNIPLVSK